MEASANWTLEKIKSFIEILNTPLFKLHGSSISITSFVLSLLIFFISFKLSSFLGRVVNRALMKKAVDSGIRDSLERFTRYLFVTVGTLFSLDILGFSISSLAALGAVLMVGVGFGLQNITQNFISGIILLIERPVKVGDIIRVGDAIGKVVDIRVRSTVILTRDDISVIIPNSKLISEEVVNDSFSGNKIRQHVKVGVAYGSDLEKVKSILLEVAKKHDKVRSTPDPLVVFENFGDSSLDFDLRFWTDDLWGVDQTASQLRFMIYQEFNLKNISIPFPQRDIHIKEGRV